MLATACFIIIIINTGQAELADNAQGTGLSQIKTTHYIHLTNYIVSQSMLTITNYKGSNIYRSLAGFGKLTMLWK